MSDFVSSVASGLIAVLEKFVSKSTPLVTIANDTITAGELEGAAGGFAAFWSAMQAAIKARNYTNQFELGIDEAVQIAADFNVPFAGLAADLLPLGFALANAKSFIQVSPNSETGDWKSNF